MSNDREAAYPPPDYKAERWEHRYYAMQNGYYWAPCPVCGEWTGGHEKPHGAVRLTTCKTGSHVLTCNACKPDYLHLPWEDMPVIEGHPRHIEWRKEQGI